MPRTDKKSSRAELLEFLRSHGIRENGNTWTAVEELLENPLYAGKPHAFQINKVQVILRRFATELKTSYEAGARLRASNEKKAARQEVIQEIRKVLNKFDE